MAERSSTEAMRELGLRGLSKRWGPPRVLRLSDLPPEQRAFIAELVEVARRHARQRDSESAA